MIRWAGRARAVRCPPRVDLQVNGCGGVDVLTCDTDGYEHAAEPLLASGMTAFQPTLIRAATSTYERTLATAGTASHKLEAPRLLGVRLEGPFRSPDVAGAHDPAHLRDPDPELARWQCAAGPVTSMPSSRTPPRGRSAMGTDAIAAAGLGEETHGLGDCEVTVAEGAVRLPDGTPAGSVLTMDRAVRDLVALGVLRAEALEAASAVPAGLLGRLELGTLRPGTPADIAVLDDALQVQRTIVGGVERFAR